MSNDGEAVKLIPEMDKKAGAVDPGFFLLLLTFLFDFFLIVRAEK